MARGWESKSVESQQDADRAAHPAAERKAEDRQREARQRGLELSRTRVQQQLREATAPARRASLEAALAHLEGELQRLASER
jgi:hypothetical protein